MRTVLLLLGLLCACRGLYAQQHVVNGGFEAVSACPLEPADLYLATGWHVVVGTPDVLHTCAETRVPSRNVLGNFAGYRAAAAGQGCAGFYVLRHDTGEAVKKSYAETEALYTQLAAPLQAGRTYRVSFFVSRADSSNLAADSLYVLLAAQWPARAAPDPAGSRVLKGVAVDNTTAAWQRVQVDVTPRQSLAYLALGLPRAVLPRAAYNGLIAQGLRENRLVQGRILIAYYYLDQVSVVEVAAK
jgi:hypothetical protein